MPRYAKDEAEYRRVDYEEGLEQGVQIGLARLRCI